MLFQRINRSDPEKIFLVVKAGEALLAGRPVAMDFAVTAGAGLNALRADAVAQATACVGIADAAVASGEYGLVQCYGYRSVAKIAAPGTTASTIAANGVGAQFVVGSLSSGRLDLSLTIGAQSGAAPMFIAANTVAISLGTDIAEQDCPVFIRCM